MLVRTLGRGSSGQVCVALDNVLDRQVAVKFISSMGSDLSARRRFIIEARADDDPALSSGSLEHEPGLVVGSPDYMAPEIWRGEGASRRSDVFALGAVLYELCAGRVPFADVPAQSLPKVVQERDPPSLDQLAPGVDPRLAMVVHRCLCRDSVRRSSAPCTFSGRSRPSGRGK